MADRNPRQGGEFTVNALDIAIIIRQVGRRDDDVVRSNVTRQDDPIPVIDDAARRCNADILSTVAVRLETVFISVKDLQVEQTADKDHCHRTQQDINDQVAPVLEMKRIAEKLSCCHLLRIEPVCQVTDQSMNGNGEQQVQQNGRQDDLKENFTQGERNFKKCTVKEREHKQLQCTNKVTANIARSGACQMRWTNKRANPTTDR